MPQRFKEAVKTCQHCGSEFSRSSYHVRHTFTDFMRLRFCGGRECLRIKEKREAPWPLTWERLYWEALSLRDAEDSANELASERSMSCKTEMLSRRRRISGEVSFETWMMFEKEPSVELMLALVRMSPSRLSTVSRSI